MYVDSVTPAVPVVLIRQPPHLSQGEIRLPRLASVDLLRGVVMVLMALDHTRDFFTSSRFSPEDLAHTSGPFFLTRFVTHFCAPVFFLLAGAGGYLSLSRGKSVAQVSRFFFTRGFWLVLLDLTVIAYGWTFVLPFWSSDVLWALGWSMVVMAFLVYLPLRWIAVLGIGIVFSHNLLDAVNPAAFGNTALGLLLHGHGAFWLEPGKSLFLVGFSLIPWVGVMAAGYPLGALLLKQNWRKPVFRIGAALTIAFLFLRIFHLYGNGQLCLQPQCAGPSGPWSVQPTVALTIISFFDTLKYPPSLQFLLMTLGPALMALAWFDKLNPQRGLAKILVMFGRVPLFFYVLHLYLLHALAVWVGFFYGQKIAWLLHGGFMFHAPPAGYGHNLPFIYAMWFAAVVVSYLPCKCFVTFKQQHPDCWWLRYL